MKRRKTAGVWEPDADPMFFFAGLTYRANIFSHDPRVPALLAVNDIAQTGSPLKRSNTAWQQVLRSLDAGQPFFLDSGVFNLTNEHMRAHGITMDEALSLAPSEIDNFDWLFDTYVEILREISDQLWGYVEIDQGGMDNKEATRRRLQAAGFEPIPVYHPLNDGWEYFDTLASNYDRMCIGNRPSVTKYPRPDYYDRDRTPKRLSADVDTLPRGHTFDCSMGAADVFSGFVKLFLRLAHPGWSESASDGEPALVDADRLPLRIEIRKRPTSRRMAQTLQARC